MSTPNKKKKVVVSTKRDKTAAKKSKAKVKPTTSRKTKTSTPPKEMLYKRDNFKWMLIGLGVIALGMILMMGGSMPSPDVWDESLIYSSRRITLAPIIILIGLGIEFYAIFK